MLIWWLLPTQVYFSISENVCRNWMCCLYTTHQSVLWCEVDTTFEKVQQKTIRRDNFIRNKKCPNRRRFTPFLDEFGGQSSYLLLHSNDRLFSKAVYCSVCLQIWKTRELSVLDWSRFCKTPSQYSWTQGKSIKRLYWNLKIESVSKNGKEYMG